MKNIDDFMNYEDFDENDMDKISADLKEYNEMIKAKNNDALETIKTLIDYPLHLITDTLQNDLTSWVHCAFVQVEKSDYKSSSYPGYEFYNVICSESETDEDIKLAKKLSFMKQDVEGKYHNMVWQQTGCCEDDYSGYLLFPLNNGTYWMIFFDC